MEPFIGEIKMFGGNFAPRGYAFCNGQLLSIAQNTALFSILGTTFGGNGTTTFGLPNLQGTIPMNWGSAPSGTTYSLGQVGGVENVTLTGNQMPSHSHVAMGSNASAELPSPANAVWAAPLDSQGTAGTGYLGTAPNSPMAPAAIGPAGGSQPHENRQPFLCVTFIIATQGIFPSRN